MKLTREEYNELKRQFDELAKKFNEFEMEEEKKHFEVEIPEILKGWYYVCDKGEVYEIVIDSYARDSFYLQGIVFKTKEEAERFAKERQLLFKIKQWAEEKNGGWQPDWNNNLKKKFYIDACVNVLETNYTCWYNKLSKLPYFKSEEIALECIDLFGDEILEVLGEK
ncbi:hypothetical protein HMPREF1983_00940 [Gemella bergeri ATCC 700627]|uniref:Uncharacterized protein n=1 Tax=Gemella bergeri ATCC 700627 TaxID=1321820 RepID=U2S4X2_9BACL|nr:hypothetical protein [Gemella bergeri]ERK57837.1 hypothetical protein HMPREF1983_00940 [Gemella bergeri ATCC 700627]